MLIELNDVHLSYMAGSPAETSALTGVSVSIGPGDFVALIGPTGSGKSTLAQIMAGLLAPTSGRVRIQGTDIWADPKEIVRCRRSVGLVMQQPEKQLFETTVGDDIAFWPKSVGLAPDDIRRRVRSAMAVVGLDYEAYAGRSPFTLSGGEMRKVAIAGILVLETPVLIMDEPTVGLDPRGKRDLLELIKKINENGTAVVMVTHDLDVVAETARRVMVLRDGRLLCDTGLRKAFTEPAGAAADLGVPTAALIARLMSKRGFVVDGDPLTIDELAESVLAALERVSA